MSSTLVGISLIVLSITNIFCNIRWMALDHYPHNEIWEINKACSKKYGLTGKQVRFCKHHFPWMKFVQEAVSVAREECQHVLRKRRWNCLTLRNAPKYKSDLKKDTKHSALIYALSAASLAITVSRGCKTGQIAECSCQNERHQVSFPSEMIRSNNLSNIDTILPCKGIVHAGKEFVKTFTNLGFRVILKNEFQRREIAVRRHNIDIGLKALGVGEIITCTCNGATAGCTTQFCFRKIIQLKTAAEDIFKKYENAVKISKYDFVSTGTMETSKEKIKLPHQIIKKAHENELIYLVDTSQHCATSRRRCVLDDTKPDGCENLCCGRGYRAQIIEVHEQCRCKFVYCCKVLCDNCISMKQIFECL